MAKHIIITQQELLDVWNEENQQYVDSLNNWRMSAPSKKAIEENGKIQKWLEEYTDRMNNFYINWGVITLN